MISLIKSLSFRVGAEIPQFDDATVKNEPMLFNCDMEHAYKLGGPITRAWLDRMPLDWHEEPCVIDTRVHMLMRGWYPCIPGWHHDDVPRTREDGQPNYGPGQDRASFALCLVNGDVAPTEFALGSEVFPTVPLGGTVYAEWHPEVEKKIELGRLRRVSAPSNRIIYFNDRTWHRGVAAVRDGWRWFGRIGRYFDAAGNSIARRNARTNEVRRQVQVYMDNVNAGW